MLSPTPGKKLNKYTPNYCIFDLETTGTYIDRDEVVEISAVKVLDGKVADEFSMLVNPERHIPAGASNINGITDDMVADAPTFDIALKDFLDFAGDLPLVGHNISYFDMKFICRDAMKYWGMTVGNDYIDTLLLARMYLPELKGKSLTDLAVYYAISPDGAHRALNDCRMNRKVFERLAQEMAHPSDAAKAVPKCPKCGSMLKIRNGKFGEFWGCTGYPDCKYTRNL